MDKRTPNGRREGGTSYSKDDVEIGPYSDDLSYIDYGAEAASAAIAVESMVTAAVSSMAMKPSAGTSSGMKDDQSSYPVVGPYFEENNHGCGNVKGAQDSDENDEDDPSLSRKRRSMMRVVMNMVLDEERYDAAVATLKTKRGREQPNICEVPPPLKRRNLEIRMTRSPSPSIASANDCLDTDMMNLGMCSRVTHFTSTALGTTTMNCSCSQGSVKEVGLIGSFHNATKPRQGLDACCSRGVGTRVVG